MLNCRSHIFWVSVGEAEEFVLVQVHDDELVCRRQVHRHLGELLVEVTGVPTVPLQVEFMGLGKRESKMGGRIEEEKNRMDCKGDEEKA